MLSVGVLGEHVHHLLGVGDDRVGESGEPSIFQVQDPVRNVEDAIIVGNQQDGCAPLPGQGLHAIDHLAARRLVERRCRFVRQQPGRLSDQGARNGHALALPPRQLLSALVGVRAQADRLQHRIGPRILAANAAEDTHQRARIRRLTSPSRPSAADCTRSRTSSNPSAPP